MLSMIRLDTAPLYAATPVLYWPVLWWNLLRLRAWMMGLGTQKSWYLRILTDGRGRIRTEWIVAPVKPPEVDLSHTGPSQYALDDLDWLSRILECQDRPALEAFALLRVNHLEPVAAAAAPLEPG